MAKSPQSFAKRQRERRAQLKRQEKRERRQERIALKESAKATGDAEAALLGEDEGDSTAGASSTTDSEALPPETQG